MDIRRVTLCLSYVIFYLDICLSQKDCTGVDCPVLQNCIEEVLEAGACCATCRHRGCTCEGYQYYDCLHAGFRQGKVPQGESYFVDFGSTECSCPPGGGKISCRFIPCPEVPANCIDVTQPEDGCPQCGRVGCIHGDNKYEAGHSFHMDPCQMCYCPNDGGRLVCSPVPGCDAHGRGKAAPSPPTENGDALTDGLSDDSQTDPTEAFSRLPPGHTLPLYRQDPPSISTGEYDYTPPEPTSAPPRGRHRVQHSASSPPTHSEAGFASSAPRGDSRREPGETTGSQGQDRKHEGTAQPLRERSEHVTGTTAQSVSPDGPRRPRQETSGETVRRHHGDAERGDAVPSSPADKEHGHHKPRDRTHHISHAQGRGGQTDARREEQRPHQTIQMSPSRRAPLRVREEGDKPRRQAQTLHHYPQTAEGQGDVSGEELLGACCATGERRATANGSCNDTDLPAEERHSVCRTAQQQCCLGALREQRCLAGVRAATSGALCQDSGECGEDSYTECCACCWLGLRLHGDGQRCQAPPHLGPRCRQSLLTCCRGEGGEAGEEGGWHPVKERPLLDPPAPPTRVSDSPFQKEAFSIGEEEEQEEEVGVRQQEEEENVVESPFQVEDMDECALYPDSLCQQRCVNTPGSFRCECFAGFSLEPDGLMCVPDEPEREEGNGVEEHHRAPAGGVVESTSNPPLPPPPTTTTTTTTTTTPLNPCEGQHPCAQQCTPLGGRVQCSCSPGFALKSDGHSCEDVNECLSLRACPQDQRCVNTAGSHECHAQITCPPGTQINNGMCEDIDECLAGGQLCAQGFDCVNTEGSFRCAARPACPPGFGSDAQGNCVDVDECLALSQPCAPGFSCLNTAGSYTCQRKMLTCRRGYHASADATRCMDVDECQNSVHRCADGQLCHNLPGSYRCDCPPGYQYDAYRRSCVDVNECWRYAGRLCAQSCENTPGSYLCSCSAGFSLGPDARNCQDVNECEAGPCSQECANMYGSYQCYCNHGYHLRADAHTCEDIDECAQSGAQLCAYRCVNVPGSYRCVCPEHGYSTAPNGHSCRDIDECATGVHNCSLAETCYNIRGGHRCLDLSCPQNYRKAADTSCERTGCSSPLDCEATPLRISSYFLSFQSDILVPAQIFRIGPSPAYTGDDVIVTIARGNGDNYFSTRKLNAYTGAVFLQRRAPGPRDFLLEVEMKLWRQGSFTTFQARIYVFITGGPL